MWGRGKTGALLVGMQTGEATVENSMEVPQKTKNGTAFWPSNSTAGYTLKILKHQFKNPMHHTEGAEMYEKMLNVTNHQRNAN